MIDLSPCDSEPGCFPRRREPREERVLHVHLGAPGEPQTSLQSALYGLAAVGKSPHGKYRSVVQVNWCDYAAKELPKVIMDAADLVQPTLIWMQLQGKVLEPSFLRILRRRHPNALIVSWCGDVGRSPAWSHELAPEVDALLFSSQTQVEEHRAAGFPNAAYLQIGYDTDIHHETDPPGRIRPGDVCFLGQNYNDAGWTIGHEAQLRRDAVYTLNRELRKRDFMFEVYGQNWWSTVGVKDREQSAEVYRTCKAALSISLTSNLKRYSSDRLLRALACGPVVLVKKFAEMSSWGLRDGDNCVVWDTVDELLESALEICKMPTIDAFGIGRRGAALAREHHTWGRRMKEQAVYLEYIREQRQKR